MSRSALGSIASGNLGVLLLLTAVVGGALLVTGSGSQPGAWADSARPPAGAKLLVQGGTLFLPGAAHVTGAADTNWRTDVEVFNTGGVLAQFEIAMLRRDQANPQPANIVLSLQPGQSVRYNDILWSLFGFDGSAALRITAQSGAVMVSSRTYNQTSIGTYGQYIGGAIESRAIVSGQQGRIIQLTHNRSTDTGYRTNVGFVNTTASPMVVQADFYTAQGVLLGTRSYNLEPFMFTQKERIFQQVTQDDVNDGYVVVTTPTTGGAFFAYASVVDNRTGDPIYIPAILIAGGAQPTPTRTPTGTQPPSTPTPTRTPTPTQTPTQPFDLPNLLPYQVPGWDGPLVVSGQPGTTTSGGLTGGQPTYVDWALLNDGQSDAVFPVDSYIVGLSVDGSPRVAWVAQNTPFTLPAGSYASIVDYVLSDIGPGAHTVTMTGDPLEEVPESDETDNSYTYSGTWSGLEAAGPSPDTLLILDAASLPVVPIAELEGDLLWGRTVSEYAHKRALAARDRGPARFGSTKTVGEPVYIPAAAHVAGAAGTNWRTDLELHNPGTAQAQYEIALLQRDANNAAPQTAVFSVPAGGARRLADVLFNTFGVTGGAALRITPLAGTVMVTSRTYNLTDQGTYGQFIGGAPESEAIDHGEDAVVIQLSHQQGTSSGYRANVGFVSCVGSQITVQVDLYRSTGVLLGSRNYALPPYGHTQVDRIFQQVAQGDVSDGYVVARTITPGGRFFAYASVVDNATGDPVYAPATVMDGGGPPPTPTPTPTVGPGVPIEPLGVVEQLFDLLGTLTDPGVVDFETFVANVQSTGLQAVLNTVPIELPGVVTVGTNSLSFNFPPGYVSPDGIPVYGLAEVTFTNVNVSPGNFGFNFAGSQQGLQVQGAYPTIEQMSGTIAMTTDSLGHVSGNATFSGSGGNPLTDSMSTINGDVDVDTEICPNYPIAGQIVVQREEGRHEFGFDDSCDGTFVYIGPGQTGALAFRLRWQGPQDLDLYVREPNGEVIYYGYRQSSTGGQLDVDANAGCSGPDPDPTENIFWPEGQAPAGTYEYWADLWSPCGASETPQVTLYVIRNGVIAETHPDQIVGGQTEPRQYQYP